MSGFGNNLFDVDPDFLPDVSVGEEGQPDVDETAQKDTRTTEKEPNKTTVDDQQEQEPKNDQQAQDENDTAQHEFDVDDNGNIIIPKDVFDSMNLEKAKFEKQYKNLQPQFTKVSQELSRLRKEGLNPKQEEGEVPVLPASMQVMPVNQPGQAVAQNQQPVNRVTEIIESYIEARLKPVTEMMKDSESETAISRKVVALERANPEEFDDVMPVAKEYLAKNPGLWQLGEETAMDMAYEAARGKVLKAVIAKEIEDGIQNRESRKQYKDEMPKNKSRAQDNSGQKKSKAEEIADEIVSISHISNVGSAFRS
jgi:hypothetical protein